MSNTSGRTYPGAQAYGEELADRIRAELSSRDVVVEKTMFGGIAFMLEESVAFAALPMKSGRRSDGWLTPGTQWHGAVLAVCREIEGFGDGAEVAPRGGDMRASSSRLPSILAHVLASTALLACGGKTAEVGDDLFGNSPSGTSSSSGGSSGTPTPPNTTTPPTPTNPPPPTKDAGVPPTKPDAGCSTPPELVRSGNGCSDVYYLACGYPAGVDPVDGFDQTECAKLCGKSAQGFSYWSCGEYLSDDLPGPSVECYTCVEGRRPEGFIERPLVETVAGWLAHAADLERVSIDAFRILARELAFHRAPHELVAAACRAAEDEVRHANALGGLARREGATLEGVAVEHRATRGLLAIALENAVEGCVRETFGAIVAGWQAEHAHRVDIRRAMARIYVDETSHADLAWNVHAWLMTKLSADERAEVDAAMDRAFAELTRSAGYPLPDPWITDLGLPRPAQARRMVRDLVASLKEYARAA